MKSKVLIVVLTFFAFCGCVEEDLGVTFPTGEVEGLRPVYGQPSEVRNIQVEAPGKLENPGKIYRKDGFLYINEIGKGVHVINNNDPANPQIISFINIPGNVDIAAKGNVFYFDNFRDLVAVRITNGDQIELLKRLENVLPSIDKFPPENNVYFECVDESKGIVVAWEKTTISNPKCYR